MKAVISIYSTLFSQKFILCEAITCSTLSDSGEDAKVKGTRKGGSGGKKEIVVSLYFHVHAFSNMWTRLSQRWVQKRELFRPEQSKGLGKLVWCATCTRIASPFLLVWANAVAEQHGMMWTKLPQTWPSSFSSHLIGQESLFTPGRSTSNVIWTISFKITVKIVVQKHMFCALLSRQVVSLCWAYILSVQWDDFEFVFYSQ